MGRKYTYEEVKVFVNSLGYELISKEYINNKQKLVLKDNEGYFYLINLHDLKISKPYRFHKSNIYTIENIKLWLTLENMSLELLSKTYTNNHTYLTFKDNEGYFYNISLIDLQQSKYSKFYISNIYTIKNIKLWLKLNKKPFELLSKEYSKSDKMLQWRCLDCGEVFEKKWKSIITGKGCPFCAGYQVGLSNCLATKRPELISSWHPTKNDNLTPWDVTCGDARDIWWQCLENDKHEWVASPNSRTNANSGCPYCCSTHPLPSEDYNLLLCNSKLASEWNHSKNIMSALEYTPNSNKKVWWKCKECEHEWEASICERNRKDGKSSGCPRCNDSKGEKRIRDYLNFYNYKYMEQKKFEKLVGLGNGKLSYDFYLLGGHNILIEYQGEYHDGSVSNQTQEDFERQQEHDKRKREYAKNNNIRLLEIWYYDIDKIEEILEMYLNNF